MDLKKVKKNREYYSKSDNNFMRLDWATYAHQHLDRVAWVREWVHGLNSHQHLDVGCKDGYTCLTLQAEGVDCYGIDPSEDAVLEATTRTKHFKLDAKFQVMFGEDVPEDWFFTTVSCLEVIEHVVKPELLLKKLSNTGEFIMISTPLQGGKFGTKLDGDNEEHLRIYTYKELEDLVKPFGQIVEHKKDKDEQYIIFHTLNNG